MSDSKFIKVFSGNIFEAERLKEALEAEGISPVVKNDNHIGVSAYLVTDYQELKEVFVHESEEEKALEIVESTFPRA
ncbi:MAG TPA: DUF2007 domain-containing protein [Flavobacteriaceae bacterium]|nr:DUF2007 domain-containing protein [Flavobacteriaceae bacterium]